MAKMVQLYLGSIMCDRYQLEQFISCGGFGQVYLAKDLHTHNIFAAKIETLNSNFPLLMKEAECMRELDMFAKQQRCDKIPQFYGFGMTGDFRYLWMELLGKNVRELKKSTPVDRFSLGTSLWICKQMLLAIEFLHRNGWIHRDIKPANFCLSYFGPRRLVLVDFGTTEKNNSHQKMYGFCGTERYASLRTHQRLSAHPSDDLWGLYYIAVENMNCRLLWRDASSRENIASIKRSIQENSQIIQGLAPDPCFTVTPPPSSMKSVGFVQMTCK
ncbi:protein kinase domain-containing protein [Ditylenchus destructor]|nr:protein kinase domain-containing protein [Ditylenchus destructor]